MLTRQQIVDEARTWMDVKWVHQGRTRLGIDCAGLVVKTAHAIGYTDFDCVDYGRQAQMQKLMEHFSRELESVPLLDLKPGDVVLFRDKIYPCHVAIVTEKHGQLHIIHSHATRRKVLEEPLAPWKDRWVCGFRFREVQ